MQADPLSQLLMELVGLAHPGPDNPNVAPTETVPVLRVGDDGAAEIVPMRWWLTPFWAKELTTRYSMFNAKSETAAKSPAFKEPFVKRRCVVPVSGFYEWSRNQSPHQEPAGTGKGAAKTPYFMVPRDHDGLLLAGLWDRWRNRESGDELLSFTVLTTQADAALEFVHHRQPVMLSLDEARQWLDTDIATSELEHLLHARLPMALEAVPVSTAINNARNKAPDCVVPVADPVSLASTDSGGVH